MERNTHPAGSLTWFCDANWGLLTLTKIATQMQPTIINTPAVTSIRNTLRLTPKQDFSFLKLVPELLLSTGLVSGLLL